MDSESEDFQVTAHNTTFFSGFATAPKLNEKQRKLREEVCADSILETKQTTLDQKVNKIKASKRGEEKYVKRDAGEVSQVKVAI